LFIFQFEFLNVFVAKTQNGNRNLLLEGMSFFDFEFWLSLF